MIISLILLQKRSSFMIEDLSDPERCFFPYSLIQTLAGKEHSSETLIFNIENNGLGMRAMAQVLCRCFAINSSGC